ncbi:Ig-like domain-containing protein [Flagellimonas profundi]|uniref:Ig-like domain-containing protein n=1 Tax=Flagellimonas profundi TaxID=2915620 RepID=A0ABS3FJY1_9FLAO|nr:Ig-like domain-containing protein [Allomuricauda profundi]MBO0343475.1 Ig-like domain-containing protein [Allomuricauda profundi]
MKTYKNPILQIGFILVLLFIGCNDDDEGVILDDTILRVLTTNITETDFDTPVEGVPVNTSVEIIFSHSLDMDAVSSALDLSSGSGSVNYEIEFSNTNSTVSLMPVALDYETNYTLTLPAGTYGTKGEELDNPLSINFTTAAFVPPTLTLASNVSELDENGQAATVTASLNKVANSDVTATLIFGGSATKDSDYSISTVENIVIPQGELSVSFDITTNLDGENEGNEIIEISLDEVTNATNGSESIEIAILEQLPALSLKGVMALTWDGSGTNDGKAVHLVANQDIADLSLYGLGTANNGGGTDGKEFTLPAISVSAGDDILVARETALLTTYFGGCTTEFEHVLDADSAINQNGDDAIELYQGDVVIETYGDVNVDGTGEPWEYSGSWAYKFDGFWTTGGVDCSIGSATVADSSCPYPICSEALALKGVLALLWEGSGTNGGKAVHLKANKDIPDLSIYSVGVANNGGGTDGIEFTLPAIAVEEGDDILLAREQATIATYFGSCTDSFEFIIETGSMNQNGDDAIELYNGDVVVETYGDVDVDGTGAPWEYSGSWAYKVGGTWTVGGVDCAAGSTTTQESSCTYPACN